MKKVIIPVGIIGLIVIVAVAVGGKKSQAAVTTGLTNASSSSSTNASTVSSSATYKDGTYSATGSYESPDGTEQVGVQLTVAGGRVSSVTVTPEARGGQSVEYEQMFADGISSVVVGKPLGSNFDVSEVNGSSLTGGGFNQALQSIRAQAQS